MKKVLAYLILAAPVFVVATLSCFCPDFGKATAFVLGSMLAIGTSFLLVEWALQELSK